MKVRLYFDDDVGRKSLIRALRARGVDAVSSFEAGMYGRSDDEHLAYAASESRALVTANRGDFLRLHSGYLANGQDHSGLIIVIHELSVGEVLRRLGSLLDEVPAEAMINRVEFLTQRER